MTMRYFFGHSSERLFETSNLVYCCCFNAHAAIQLTPPPLSLVRFCPVRCCPVLSCPILLCYAVRFVLLLLLLLLQLSLLILLLLFCFTNNTTIFLMIFFFGSSVHLCSHTVHTLTYNISLVYHLIYISKMNK